MRALFTSKVEEISYRESVARGEERAWAFRKTLAQPVYFRQYGWDRIYAYRNCLCPDGKRRRVEVQEPDTFFSAPASVRVSHNGKRYFITGFVVSREVEYEGEFFLDFEFMLDFKSKNTFVFGKCRK